MAASVSEHEALITIPVDAELARLYQVASPELKHKIQLLLNLRLRSFLLEPPRSLSDIMDAIGKTAESHGMTPEILEELLRDE